MKKLLLRIYKTFKTVFLNQVEKMLIEGAAFIDIGAYSSRPGANFVSEEEELQLTGAQRLVGELPPVGHFRSDGLEKSRGQR